MKIRNSRPAVKREWFNGREFRTATWHDGRGTGGTVMLVHVVTGIKSPSVFRGTLTARRVIGS